MSRLQRWFPTFLALYRWWRLRLTTPGRLLAVALLASLHGVAGEQPMSIQLFSLLALTMAVAGGAGRLFRPRLSCAVHVPAAVRRGRPLELRVTCVNRSSRSCYDLGLSLPLSGRQAALWELIEIRFPCVSLAPGESAGGTVVVRPLRRGRRRPPPLRLTSTFPLNLMYFHQGVAGRHDITVTPDFVPLEHVDLKPRSRGDIRSQSTLHSTGESWEYCGSREYQEGLPVRRWDYGAWARLGEPAVREFEAHTQANAVVLADTFAEQAGGPRSGGGPLRQLEDVLSVSAALLDALRRERWRVQMLCLGDEQPWTAADGAADGWGELMERLATAKPAAAADAPRLAERALQSGQPLRDLTVFVVLGGWDADRDAAVQELARQCDDLRLLMPSGTQPAPPLVARSPAAAPLQAEEAAA